MDRWDLKGKKTKEMKLAQESGVCEVRIREQVIKQVEEVKYVGVMISKMSGRRREVETRIVSVTRMVGGMS